jgi:hypothetical protein
MDDSSGLRRLKLPGSSRAGGVRGRLSITKCLTPMRANGARRRCQTPASFGPAGRGLSSSGNLGATSSAGSSFRGHHADRPAARPGPRVSCSGPWKCQTLSTAFDGANRRAHSTRLRAGSRRATPRRDAPPRRPCSPTCQRPSMPRLAAVSNTSGRFHLVTVRSTGPSDPSGVRSGARGQSSRTGLLASSPDARPRRLSRLRGPDLPA